jgi:hypothetical protein
VSHNLKKMSIETCSAEVTSGCPAGLPTCNVLISESGAACRSWCQSNPADCDKAMFQYCSENATAKDCACIRPEGSSSAGVNYDDLKALADEQGVVTPHQCWWLPCRNGQAALRPSAVAGREGCPPIDAMPLCTGTEEALNLDAAYVFGLETVKGRCAALNQEAQSYVNVEYQRQNANIVQKLANKSPVLFIAGAALIAVLILK